MIALIVCMVLAQTGLEAGQAAREEKIQFNIGRYNVDRDTAVLMVDKGLSKDDAEKLQLNAIGERFTEFTAKVATNDESARKKLMNMVKTLDRVLTNQANIEDKEGLLADLRNLKGLNNSIRAQPMIYSKRTIELTKQLDNRIDRVSAKLSKPVNSEPTKKKEQSKTTK